MMTNLFFAGLFAAAFLLAGSRAEANPVPKLINYQGKLVQADSANPLGNGVYQLRFELFDAAAAGTLVWGETQQVAVAGGVFNVILGAEGAVPVAGAAVNNLGFAFGAADRFLQTTIISGPGGAINQTLAPRQQLTSVPYSLASERAALAESLIPHLAQALNPPGAIIAYAGEVTDENVLVEPVPGYLLCNGAVIDAAADGKYAALQAVLRKSWGDGGNAGNNSSVANLPDLRGVFLRGWSGSASDDFRDPNAGDSQRVARKPGGNTGNKTGSFQEDQFQGHGHYFSYGGDPSLVGILGSTGGGANNVTWQQANNVNPNLLMIGGARPDGINGSPRTGLETRPKNANVVYLIKY